MKKISRHPLFMAVVVFVASVYARALYRTLRIRVVGELPDVVIQGPVVFALWHQQLAFAPVLARVGRRPLLALMSGSRDGAAMRALAAYFGIEAAVGSSHKGALAGTRGLLRAAKEGKNLMITPDGPRGPAHEAKPGAVEVARMARLPLVPCAAWATRGKHFASWDRFLLPHPFATLYVVMGAPLADGDLTHLQVVMNTLTAQAQAACGDLAETSANL